jgi:hypothetical protein
MSSSFALPGPAPGLYIGGCIGGAVRKYVTMQENMAALNLQVSTGFLQFRFFKLEFRH